MFLVVFVLGPRGGRQATSFLHGGCSARYEDVFFFVPCQTKAGRSRLFETPLDLIVSFAVMSESFCWHTQCLIQRRFSTLIVLLENRLFCTVWATIVVDGEVATFDVEPVRSKRGFRQ